MILMWKDARDIICKLITEILWIMKSVEDKTFSLEKYVSRDMLLEENNSLIEENDALRRENEILLEKLNKSNKFGKQENKFTSSQLKSLRKIQAL